MNVMLSQSWIKRILIVFLTGATSANFAGTLPVSGPTGGDPRTRSYVISNVYLASDNRPDACPSYTLSSLDVYLRTLPPHERANYEQADKPGFAAPEKRKALTERFYKAMGFKRLQINTSENAKRREGFRPEEIADFRRQLGLLEGKGRVTFMNMFFDYDSCTNPEDFPNMDSGLHLYEGEVAAGINLDDSADADDFTGLDGEKGVDNQLWRVLGCIWSVRDLGNPKEAATRIMSGQRPTLIELSDVDSTENDDNVQIRIQISADPVALDANGGAMHGATLTPKEAPAPSTSGKGKIVNGVLISDRMEIKISWREQILDYIRDVQQAQLRMEFQHDGSVKGQIAGYQTLDSVWEYFKQATQGSADQTGYSCPAVYSKLSNLADGLRDPATGKNRGISAAYHFLAVPAFVAPPVAVVERASRAAKGSASTW